MPCDSELQGKYRKYIFPRPVTVAVRSAVQSQVPVLVEILTLLYVSILDISNHYYERRFRYIYKICFYLLRLHLVSSEYKEP